MNHEDRPRECSTKFLESIEKMVLDGSENVDFLAFVDELKRRRGNYRDLKALRASRRASALERKLERAAKHQMYFGDVRKMK